MRQVSLRFLCVAVLLLTMVAAVAAQGGSVSVGESVTEAAAGSDVTYSITLDAGQTVELDLRSEDFDPLVRVLDANGSELASDDDSGSTGLDSLLTFTASDGGDYTIVVTSFFGDPEGDFTLAVNASSGGGTGGAGDLQVGDSITDTANGNMSYAISLESGQSVTISVSSSDFDTYLEVQDSGGTTLASDDDSGDGLNSMLEFTAPATATYTLIVRSFGGDASGTFTLSVDSGGGGTVTTGVTTLEYGQSVEVNPDGATQLTFSFSGSEGDIINAYAVSSTGEDSVLYLYDPAGAQIGYDDDSGCTGSDPVLLGIQLPDSGEYTLELRGYSDGQLLEPVTVTLEQADTQAVSSGPTTLTLSEENCTNAVLFEVEDDAQYLLSVETSEDISGSLYVYVKQEGEDYAATNFTIAGASSFAAIFTADETGVVSVQLQSYLYDQTLDFTVSIEPMN